MGDIRGKFSIFGWKTFEIDGHNMGDIINTLNETDHIKGSPSAIIAHTVKGKGVSFAENNPAYHNAPLSKEQLEQAKKDIMETISERATN